MVGTDLGGAPLTANEQEIITAGCTIGAIFGASILGALADKIGRKWAMGISDIFFTVGAIILAASVNVPMAIVSRLILGESARHDRAPHKLNNRRWCWWRCSHWTSLHFRARAHGRARSMCRNLVRVSFA